MEAFSAISNEEIRSRMQKDVGAQNGTDSDRVGGSYGNKIRNKSGTHRNQDREMPIF